MASQPNRKRPGNAGFTVIEVVLVAALASLLVALLYPPMVNGMVMVQRERTTMNMFRDGDALMSRLTSYLQPAILPIPVTVGSAPAATSKYRRYIDSMDRGFMRYGREWRDILRAGTDFLPYCVPTKYPLNESWVDSDGLPVLGIISDSGLHMQSAVYFLSTRRSSADGERFFGLETTELAESSSLSNNLHPALAGMDPSDYGLSAAPVSPLSPVEPRFGEDISFTYHGFTAVHHKRGFGVVRFVTLLRDGAPVILDEADLSLDLNHDGTTDDVFARGSLHLTVAEDASSNRRTVFPVPDGSVLLQLNRQDPGYVPLFQLVGGYGGHGNSPSGAQWNGSTPPGSDAYTLLVRVLLLDETQDRTVLATGRRDGRQYITRQFQTSIELRNMSLE